MRLEAVGNCALYAVGTAGDSLCAQALEVVLYVLEVLKACAVCCSAYWRPLRGSSIAGGVGDAGGDAFRATLYAGGCGGWALFAGDAGGTRGDALSTLYARGGGGWAMFTGGVGGVAGAGGDAVCATLYAGGCGGFEICWR